MGGAKMSLDTADPHPVTLILLGPPGAGKGTQARMLEQKHGLVQLSTGDLLRGAVAARTAAGLAAQEAMDRGELVSDRIVLDILTDRLNQPDTRHGVILDGFPRTEAQAEALDRLLEARGRRIDAAISLKVDDEAMVERVSGRFTCASCGEGYHDSFKQPARFGICDVCEGTAFKRRADDNAETVRTRLSAYHAETAPLIDYYAARGALTEIPAMGEIGEIAAALDALIERLGEAQVSA
ncbi:adenylate kinase [Rhodobacterales bacterium HKCCE2091]|nr:adenylate kinase [Rhodobacterales bacterium HKCCE2091]